MTPQSAGVRALAGPRARELLFAQKRFPRNEQRFNLRERDWNDLKRLVEGSAGERGLVADAAWKPTVLSDAELAGLILAKWTPTS
jgi:hypothetical protein